MNDKERIKKLEETLAWYGEQARLCRLIHSGGDEGRHALANDGGKRAREALKAPPRTSKELLIAARELLSDKERWTKGSLRYVHDEDDRPDSFCLLGAINNVSETIDDTELVNVILPQATDTVRSVIDGGIMTFNDHPGTTHAEVLEVLDKAIEASHE